MKKLIALLLLGMILPVMASVATAQDTTPTSEQLEALSQQIESKAEIAGQIQRSIDEVENPHAASQATSVEDRWAKHLAEMENWSMGQKLIFGVKLLVLGMIVVMGVLVLIATITGYLNNFEIKREEEIERRKAAAKAKSVEVAQTEGIDGATVAAIVGAVTAVMRGPLPVGSLDGRTVAAAAGAITAVLKGRKFRIKSIKLASNAGSAWSQHGRQSIMASHSLERKSR